MPLVSSADYARHRKANNLPGGSAPAVTYAIQSGRIVRDPNTGLIDVEQADKDWEANTDPSIQKHALKAAAVRTSQITGKQPVEQKTRVAPQDYNISRSNKEYYQAELERLKFEEKAGTLVAATTAKKVLYEAGRIIRSGHEDMIAQLAPVLASEVTIDAVERILKQALTRLDDSLADRIAKLEDSILAVEESDVPDDSAV